jgi:hypothetical protein
MTISYYSGTSGDAYNLGSDPGTPNLAEIAGDFAREGQASS